MTSSEKAAGFLTGTLTAFAVIALAASASWAGDDYGYGDPDTASGEQTTASVESLENAFFGGTPWLNLRYRFESVDEDSFAEDADAHTVRTRFGYETGFFMDISLGLEIENITPLGGENYNDTVNGKTQFPTVADAETTEVNQAYIRLAGVPQSVLTFGRQRVVLDNHRFVGDVGFRQNQQTFDTLTLANQSVDDFTLTYGYVWGVRRVFGEDSAVGTFNTDVHLINLANEGFAVGKAVGYVYILDIDDSAIISSTSLGIRLTGTNALNDAGLNLVHALEFARQSDYADNPNDIDLNYYIIQPGLKYAGLTTRVGYEVLEGDGTSGFQTPLATLHRHQGWADKFLVTPADGIEEWHAKLIYAVPGDDLLSDTKLWAVYHDFDSENTSADLGSEIDLKISKTFFKHLTLAATWASFDADTHSTDTDKLFLEATLKF